jgi:subtilisin family serine protease
VEVDVARGDAGDALAALRADPGVRWAEVDHRRSAFADPPDDPLYGSEWALPEINAPDAWSSATGAGVTVAIVDSGADASHPDLAGAIDPASRDLVGDGGSDFADGAGHGTHVAGIVGARRDNGIGVAGVAPDADLLILRALDDAGSGYDSDIAEAFDAAADAGARIVNASLGGTGGGTILETAIAAHPGTLFVVAAGNDGRSDDSTPEYPCSLPDANVLCVGASTASDRRASFSNYGRRSVDVFAPGQGILSTYPAALQSPPATGYATLDGTSMATPMVSGEAALLLQAAPSLSTAALKDAILSSGVAGSSYATRSVSGSASTSRPRSRR